MALTSCYSQNREAVAPSALKGVPLRLRVAINTGISGSSDSISHMLDGLPDYPVDLVQQVEPRRYG
jgi:hypothetical protein